MIFSKKPDRIRLEADIQGYLDELRVKYPGIKDNAYKIYDQLSDKKFKGRKKHQETSISSGNIDAIIADLLAESLHQVEKGYIDYAWRLMNKAKQIEILGITDKAELIIIGKKIFIDSSNATDNRKKAIKNILKGIMGTSETEDVKKTTDTANKNEDIPFEKKDGDEIRKAVFTAAKILGEHYDNEGFKVAIRTQSFRHFRILLCCLLLIIPIVTWAYFSFLNGNMYLFRDGSPALAIQMISVELLGMLGAVFSVIISYSRKPISGKIPQQKLIFQKSELRPFIGAASGLVLLILYKSHLVLGENLGSALYAFAFISGFSERFIVSQIDNTILKNSDQEKKNNEDSKTDKQKDSEKQ